MAVYAPPRRRPCQQELVSLWRELLRVEPVGIDDDFFDLGGHSLLAIRMLGHVHDEVGVRLHLSRAGRGGADGSAGWPRRWTAARTDATVPR